MPWSSAQGCWLQSGAGKGTATTPELSVTGRYLHVRLAGTFLASVEVHVKLPNGNFLKTRADKADNSGDFKPMVIDLLEAGVSEPLVAQRIKVVVRDDSEQADVRVDGLEFSANATPTTPKPPLFGFVDLHTHPFQQVAFGGDMFHGRIHSAIDERGNIKPGESSRIEVALEDCQVSHGKAPDGRGTALLLPLEDGHDSRGAPTFVGWPHWRTKVHQQMYVDWLRRAWEGGLRIVHVDVTTSHLLAEIYDKGHPHLKHDRTPNDLTDDWNLRTQLKLAREFVQLPDVKDFAAVARTPEDARKIVGEGKLALVLGAELDDFGGFRKRLAGLSDAEARKAIRAYVDDLYKNYDLRHVFPIHVADNGYGGAAIYNALFLLGSVFESGTAPRLRNAFAEGVRLRVDVMLKQDSIIEIGATLFPPLKTLRDKILANLPTSAPLMGHANDLGLTRAGEILVEELMRAGIIVDIDHMSDRAADRTLELAQLHGMPVVSSHTGFRDLAPGAWVLEKDTQSGVVKLVPNTSVSYPTNLADLGFVKAEGYAGERDRSGPQLAKIAALGGMVGVGTGAGATPVSWGSDRGVARTTADCDGSTKTFAQHYLYAVERMGGRGIALGTDANGLAGGVAPRFGANACAVAREDGLRQSLVPTQVAAQRNAVRYASPTAHNPGRHFVKEKERHDESVAWAAVEKFAAGRGHEVGPDTTGFERDVARVAHGFYLAKVGQPAPSGDALDKKDDVRAAHEVWRDVQANRASHGTRQLVIRGAWDRYHAIAGTNPPLQKSKAGTTDFDFNLDGLAHYGLLPDMLQDVRNIGLTPADLAPLFRGAEDYVRMWERIEAQKAALVRRFP